MKHDDHDIVSAHVLRRVVDHLRLGVLIIDPVSRILSINSAGSAILATETGLKDEGGYLRATGRRESARLDAMLTKVFRGDGKVAAQAHSHVVSHPLRMHGLQMMVTPILLDGVGSARLAGAPVRSAFILLSDPERSNEPDPKWLSDLFRLTPSEARLAAALAGRETLTAYAQRAGIAISTARWTLKQVLEKTGCRRQSELVHLIAMSVAGLAYRSPDQSL